MIKSIQNIFSAYFRFVKMLILLFLPLFYLQAEGISVQILNDELYDTDNQLTGALHILYQHNDNWSFRIGQDIYTPTNTDTLTPVEGERPYAAWLYIETIYQTEAEEIDTLFTFSMELGTIGERALGEEVQNGVHKIVGVRRAEGWDSQTKNTYGNMFSFTAEHSIADFLIDSRKELTHIAAYTRVNTGTIWRDYSLGISTSFGYNTPLYNSLISFPNGDAFYVFADLQVTHVERNALLEGNDGYNVIKSRDLRRYDIGLNWDIDNIRLRFTGTTMSREFITQKEVHRFGVIEITVSF